MTSYSTKLAGAVAALLAVLGLANSASAAERRSVIELFTSQGCSSCPPADALLEKLAADPRFIALSMPVDYWDSLGWKDTFAQHAFTLRQQAYSAGRGDRQVYTPQAVVNGRTHTNGASLPGINAAVEDTAKAVAVPLEISRKGEAVSVAVSAALGAGDATVVALAVIGRREVAIGRGENAKRKIAYTNIVREMVPLGRWTGSAANYAVPPALIEGADSVVVLVQSGSLASPGGILGAAQFAVR